MPLPAILKILVPIVLGAAIGYLTNDLAIRMLFRPRRAHFIGKWQIPFTPGIIPKNQGRIAGAVGAAVSGQLFTSDDLVAQLKGSAAKEEIAGKLADAVFSPDLSIRSLTAFAAPAEEELALPTAAPALPEEAGTEPEPGSDLIPDALPPDVTAAMVSDGSDPEEDVQTARPTGAAEKVGAFVADRVADKLAETDLHDAIDDLVWEGVQEYRKNPVIALFLNESAVDAICDKVENALRTYVNGDGRRVIGNLVAEEARRLADMPLCDLADRAGVDRDRVAAALSRTLDRFVEQFGASFSEKTDIGGIVRRKIEEMDPDQLECLVMSVMKRELQAVINLGAVLGAVIGAINIFI